MKITQIEGYKFLTKEDLEPVSASQIFFDPPDTEVGSWVGHDLMSYNRKTSIILDLGSGSGATAASLVRNGATLSIGVDISPNSIQWAKENYSSGEFQGKTKFYLYNFVENHPEKLKILLGSSQPNIVTSNPAYVPMELVAGDRIPSLDGGEDGLKFIPSILKYAQFFQADVGLTIGSYSSPRKAISLIYIAGYEITSLTLSTLPLSDLSLENFQQIQHLLDTGEAALWHKNGKIRGYIIIGIAAKQANPTQQDGVAVSDAIFQLIRQACQSETQKLEAINNLNLPALTSVNIRVLNLPHPEQRSHW